MIIGERLKGVLKKHNISAKQFAEMIGVTEGMIYKYYKMNSVDTKTIDKWSSVLYVSTMVFLDDEMYNKYGNPDTKYKNEESIAFYMRQKESIECNNSIAERMKSIMSYYNIDENSFAERIGDNAYDIHRLLNFECNIDMLQIIMTLKSFDSISADWLLTGKGEMFKSQQHEEEQKPITNERLLSIIESQQRTIENLSAK